MNEDRFRHGLHVLTEDVTPSDEALHRLIGKQRSREIRRRVAGGMSGLAVITALAVVAIQIRPGAPDQPPFGSPTPGPVTRKAEQIAYAHDGDIYVKDVVGKPRRITTDGSNVYDISPRLLGSEQIRWISLNPDGTSTMWDIDLGTGEKTALLETAGRINSFDAAGTKLALMVNADEQTRVYEIDLGDPTVIQAKDAAARFGLAEERWFFPPSFGRGVHYSDDTSVAWSADGTKLLVVMTFVDSATERTDETLLVLGADGTVVTDPIFGTHGRWVSALSILYQDLETKGWFVLDVETGEKLERPFPTDGTRPVISPDGTKVAMHVESPDAAPTLFVGDLETGEASLEDTSGAAPLWLDDGTLLASNVEACPGECMEGWRPAGDAITVKIATGASSTYEMPATIDMTARYSITTGGES